MSQSPFAPRPDDAYRHEYPQQGYGSRPGSYGSPVGGYPEPDGYVGQGYPLSGTPSGPLSSPYAAPGSPYPAQGSPFPTTAVFGTDPYTGLPYSDKSKVAAGLLGIFLGGFGVGRFYTGHVGLGIAQILVTWCTFGFGGIWPLIDGIMMLAGQPRDVHGRPLRP